MTSRTDQVLVALVALVVLRWAWRQLLALRRDASEVYLTQQLVVDSVRNDGESPVYKSNKLDYSSGLRLGLNIRYDHYKIRNGNMNDVWEMAMVHGGSTVTIAGATLTRNQINDGILRTRAVFEGHAVSEVHMAASELFQPESFIVLMACLVSQIPVHLHQHAPELQSNTWRFSKGTLASRSSHLQPFVVSQLTDKTEFSNRYSPAKDKGVCVVTHYKLNPRVSATSAFTQANIISAIASNLKHLPTDFGFAENDRLVVVEEQAEVMAQLIKILSMFIYPTHVTVTPALSWDHIHQLEPTILSISLASWRLLQPPPTAASALAAKVRSYFLSNGVFLSTGSKLRLTYIHASINNSVQLKTEDLNRYRALHSRAILEFGYHNVAGPVLASDLFDYRNFPFPVKAFGCLSQSLEYKLTELDGSKTGIINVRGFVIARTTSNENQPPNSDGFMPLNARGKWGSDGCLYIV